MLWWVPMSMTSNILRLDSKGLKCREMNLDMKMQNKHMLHVTARNIVGFSTSKRILVNERLSKLDSFVLEYSVRTTSILCLWVGNPSKNPLH